MASNTAAARFNVFYPFFLQNVSFIQGVLLTGTPLNLLKCWPFKKMLRVPDWHPPAPPIIEKVQVLDWQPPKKLESWDLM